MFAASEWRSLLRTVRRALFRWGQHAALLLSGLKVKSAMHSIDGTCTVLSNQRLAVFHALPPPCIICRARLVSSRASSSAVTLNSRPGSGRSMHTIMLADSIDCSERALIKSTQNTVGDRIDSEKNREREKERNKSILLFTARWRNSIGQWRDAEWSATPG